MDNNYTPYNGDGNWMFDRSNQEYLQNKITRLLSDEYLRQIKNQPKLIENFYDYLLKISDEDAKSLLYIKNHLEDQTWKNIKFDRDDYKNLLIEYLRSTNNPLQRFNELIYFKIKNYLPDHYVSWFNNDLRCALFIAYLTQDQLRSYAFKGENELLDEVTENVRYEILYFINNYLRYMPQYQRFIPRQFTGDWKVIDILAVKSNYFKNRLADSEIRWLEASNKEQVDWAYDYLSERKIILLSGVFVPTNTEEVYELILASLDVLSNVPEPNIGTKSRKGYSERGYTLYTMKKAWEAKKQYARRIEAKKGKAIKIYIKNQHKLNELCEYSQLTPNELFNKALDDTYELMLKSH